MRVFNIWGLLQLSKASPIAFLSRASSRKGSRTSDEDDLIAHLPGDKWFYLSDMHPEDLILFLQYSDAEDSRADAGQVVHAAFKHPVYNSHFLARAEPPRISLEKRSILYKLHHGA